ncbi:type II secretion system GspH family protein [Patescibacteria group bacterium]|nr:type II secretion system GspH family protein [Patescibacteria group bacterium]
MKKKSKLGFSLIELLVVATIMIVIATIGLVSYSQATRNSRNAKRKSDLEAVKQALVLYRNDNSQYPSGTNFTSMLTTINDYISFNSVSDPKSPTYDYTYSSDASVFELCATLETKSGIESYCIDNP